MGFPAQVPNLSQWDSVSASGLPVLLCQELVLFKLHVTVYGLH